MQVIEQEDQGPLIGQGHQKGDDAVNQAQAILVGAARNFHGGRMHAVQAILQAGDDLRQLEEAGAGQAAHHAVGQPI